MRDEEATSEWAWFETGKMDGPWEARWITCDGTEPRHPIFSTAATLTHDAAIDRARLYVCGLDIYDA